MQEKIAKKSPCKRECPNRCAECHIECQEYQEFHNDRKRIIEKRKQDTLATPELPHKMKRYIAKKRRWK